MIQNVFFTATKPTHALLVCFLRISTAFTTAIPSHKPTNNNNIMIRLARQSDISNIARINVANLPENYTPEFYAHHLSMWPHLALVAEECCSAPEGDGEEGITRGKLVGYALGKVGEKPGGVVEDGNEIIQIMGHQQQYAHHHQVSTVGHITSVAVVPEQRRSGVGQSLMLQLHQQMTKFHGNCYVSLHVRQYNKAAVRLYMKHLGYEIVDFVTCYYEVRLLLCLDHCKHNCCFPSFLLLTPTLTDQ